MKYVCIYNIKCSILSGYKTDKDEVNHFLAKEGEIYEIKPMFNSLNCLVGYILYKNDKKHYFLSIKCIENFIPLREYNLEKLFL